MIRCLKKYGQQQLNYICGTCLLYTSPCRIAREDTPREILDEIMVITNLQRRNTFTKMELARSLRLLNDSRKKQGYRTDIMSSSGTSTKTELAEEFGTVSYTHLDVYKRQILHNTAMKI